jgi:hypothetical protein
MRVLLLTLSTCFLASVHAAASNLDDELAKAGAARAIAESVMTDESYETMLLQLAQVAIPTIQNPGKAAGTLSQLANKDEAAFKEALLATMKQIAPKEFFVHSMQTYFAEKLSYDDLRAAVTFIRSDSGARFWRAATDQTAIAKAMDEESRRVDLDPDAIFARELKLRFPHEKVEF